MVRKGQGRRTGKGIHKEFFILREGGDGKRCTPSTGGSQGVPNSLESAGPAGRPVHWFLGGSGGKELGGRVTEEERACRWRVWDSCLRVGGTGPVKGDPSSMRLGSQLGSGHERPHHGVKC